MFWVKHCPYLHKFLVLCTNRRTQWCISFKLSPVVLLSPRIWFCFNKPWNTCAFSWGLGFLRVFSCSFFNWSREIPNAIWLKTLITTEYIEQIWLRYHNNPLWNIFVSLLSSKGTLCIRCIYIYIYINFSACSGVGMSVKTHKEIPIYSYCCIVARKRYSVKQS